MKFHYLIALTTFMSIPLFGFWADSKFPETLIKRYPRYKQKIQKINEEIQYNFKIISRDPKNAYAQQLLAQKSKELSDVICEAARNEIKEQIEEAEFVKI